MKFEPKLFQSVYKKGMHGASNKELCEYHVRFSNICKKFYVRSISV